MKRRPPSTKSGKLMIGAGALGFPVSLCALVGWPMALLGLMVSFDLEPSGEWDAPTIAANLSNLVVMGGASLCLIASPMLIMAGALILFLDYQAKKKRLPGRPDAQSGR